MSEGYILVIYPKNHKQAFYLNSLPAYLSAKHVNLDVTKDEEKALVLEDPTDFRKLIKHRNMKNTGIVQVEKPDKEKYVFAVKPHNSNRYLYMVSLPKGSVHGPVSFSKDVDKAVKLDSPDKFWNVMNIRTGFIKPQVLKCTLSKRGEVIREEKVEKPIDFTQTTPAPAENTWEAHLMKNETEKIVLPRQAGKDLNKMIEKATASYDYWQMAESAVIRELSELTGSGTRSLFNYSNYAGLEKMIGPQHPDHYRYAQMRVLVKAVLEGFDTESSPEEELLSIYKDLKKNSRVVEMGGIERTLKVLGIEIEGITKGEC